MSSIQNVDIKLQELVKNIENGFYVIPKFQRDFVWNSKDTCDLADSIIRGYPISTFLLMDTSSHSLGREPLKGSLENKDHSEYVLDGQQRITSIAKIFTNLVNPEEKNKYYFDLLNILIDNFPSDDLYSIYKEIKKLKRDDQLCRCFTKNNNDIEETKHNCRYISGKAILEGKYGSIINNFLQRNFDFESESENRDKYVNYLNYIFGNLSNYSIPVTMISKDSDLGLICRIFEKINSTGVKLTTFDLINAKSFNVKDKYNSEGLANYLSNDINHEKDIRKNNKFSNTIDNFLEFKREQDKYTKIARIARILYIYNDIKNNKTPAITNKKMLESNSEFWYDEWNNKKETIFNLIDWASNEDIIELIPSSYLEYVFGIILNNPENINDNNFMNHVKKFGLSLAIQGHSFTKSDTLKIEEFIEFSKKSTENFNFDNQLIEKPPIQTPENLEIEKFKKGTKKYKICLHIMFNEKHSSKFTHDLLESPIKTNKINDFEEHHIISKAQSKKTKNNIYDSIVNITLLNRNSNRNEIKDRDYKEYLYDLLCKKHNFIEILENNIIPLNFNKMTEEEFLEERKNKLKLYIQSYFKN